jgi:hypothetical protein
VVAFGAFNREQFQKNQIKVLNLKAFIRGIDYDDFNAALAMHLMFRNDGTAHRTILSVIFRYREPGGTLKMWEFSRTDSWLI